MTTQTLKGVSLIDPSILTGASTFVTLTISAATNGFASCFLAEGGHGAIVGIQYNCTAVTPTPNYLFSLKSIPTTRGNPVTVLGGGSPASVTQTVSVGVATATLANAYTPTTGDLIAACCEWSSGTNSATFNSRITPFSALQQCTYLSTETAGVWAIALAPPCIAPVYFDGYIGRRHAMAKAAFSNVTASTSYGALWVPAMDTLVTGVIVGVRPAAGSNLQVIMYEGSSTTIGVTPGTNAVNVSQSVNLSCDLVCANTTQLGLVFVPLTTAYTAKAGQTYRFVVLNNGTAYTTFPSLSFASQAALQSYAGPLAGCIGTTTTFTDYASGTDWRAFFVIPCVDSFAAQGGISRAQAFLGMNSQ